MPQLIAMIIIVVGAMIYMFQTFGGTGDKIEGIAQKTSVITEINNIKNGLKLAARAQSITTANNAATDQYATLTGLATLRYFAEQMNEQLTRQGDGTARGIAFNTYSAISFGGNSDNANAGNGDMIIRMVTNTERQIPGIFVDLSKGNLGDNAGFLETQIANDLGSIAIIDRNQVADVGVTPIAGALRAGDTLSESERRTPVETAPANGTNTDGMFTIYFQDFAANEVVLAAPVANNNP